MKRVREKKKTVTKSLRGIDELLNNDYEILAYVGRGDNFYKTCNDAIQVNSQGELEWERLREVKTTKNGEEYRAIKYKHIEGALMIKAEMYLDQHGQFYGDLFSKCQLANLKKLDDLLGVDVRLRAGKKDGKVYVNLLSSSFIKGKSFTQTGSGNNFLKALNRALKNKKRDTSQN